MVLAVATVPLACKSSSETPTHHDPSAGGDSDMPDGEPEAGAAAGGARTQGPESGGQPGLGEGAAPGAGGGTDVGTPGERGSWDMSFWDDAVWQ